MFNRILIFPSVLLNANDNSNPQSNVKPPQKEKSKFTTPFCHPSISAFLETARMNQIAVLGAALKSSCVFLSDFDNHPATARLKKNYAKPSTK